MAADYLSEQGIDIDSIMAAVQFGSGDTSLPNPPPLNFKPAPRVETILNASLPKTPQGSLWDVTILGGKITSTAVHDPSKVTPVLLPARTINAYGALLAPALCHPHIHLDKPFLLSHPSHSHLQIERGDFKEAMELTNAAKKNFTTEDLTERGQRLVDESIEAGVTSMRAFVEVDPIVGLNCLIAGIVLQAEASERCEIQLVAFAQLALFSNHDDGGKEMRDLLNGAVARPEVHVVGSTPYVETSVELQKKNIEYAIDLALTHNKHLDFHLDYHLDPSIEPLVWFVIATLKAKHWTSKTDKTVVLGHCTRLSLFSSDEWEKLREDIADLPISFVGLPTSDLFMMRTESGARGTLPVPRIVKEYGLNAVIGINNVGNAFTPQGCCDPISIASLGVGLYQAGTVKEAELLFECISTRARAAIGLDGVMKRDVEGDNPDKSVTAAQEEPGALQPADPKETATIEMDIEEDLMTLAITKGVKADLVLFKREKAEWTARKSISEAVYLYDGGKGRRVLKSGVLIGAGD